MNIKRLSALVAFVPLLFVGHNVVAQPSLDLQKLPRTIYSGEQGPFHVQGIAVDLERGYFYFSFTTALLKTDLEGHLIGSVTGMTGHLGCMTLNPEDGRIYASIEYKHDEIGKGILNKLQGTENDADTGFYIAIFDPDRITRPDMNAETENVMTTVYIREAVADCRAKVTNGGKEFEHRFGCSGIDGVTFAPKLGKKQGKKHYLYVAYGIYSDTLRTDNDYQVILAYDTKDWSRYEQPLTQKNLHKSGPQQPAHKYFVRTGNTSWGIQNLAYDTKNWSRYEQPLTQKNLHKSGPQQPAHKYFVRTGNTSWGIQNLAYDKSTGNIYAAVYKGKKSIYPNYSLFVIDGHKAPRKMQLQGFDPAYKGEVLSLAEQGMYDAQSNTYGWMFKWGTTGLCPLGDGYFYISHNAKSKQTGCQSSTVHLYKWLGKADQAFERVK
jgi:hypothetical protein